MNRYSTTSANRFTTFFQTSQTARDSLWAFLVAIALSVAILVVAETALASESRTLRQATVLEASEVAHCLSDDGSAMTTEICHFRNHRLAGRPTFGDRRDNGVVSIYADELIWGTDLGYSVRIDDMTIYFFGDTLPVTRWYAGKLHFYGSVLGVPYAYDYNDDRELDWVETLMTVDGHLRYETVTERAAFDVSGAETGLLNEVERHFMFPNGEPSGVEGGFWVPTGVAQVDEQTIYYWYGKYVHNPKCDQTHLLAMDVSSGEWRYIAPFADRKFIQVAPVLVDNESYGGTGRNCEIPWSRPGERGFLIYGSGMDVASEDGASDDWSFAECTFDLSTNYREGSMYLAYVSLDDLERPDVAQRIYYYTGNPDGCWARGNLDAAVPIIEDQSFGEFSVKQVPGTDYLVMAYDQYYFYLRAAKLTQPWRWSSPRQSGSAGYGNLLVDGSLEVVNDVQVGESYKIEQALFFDRVVSTWRGTARDPLMLHYGTYVYSAFTDLTKLTQGL